MDAARVIFFFGTPHAGSHYLDKTKVWIVEKIAKAASYQIPENLKSVLQPRANELFVINDEFPLVKEKISIVNFYEQKTMFGLDELVSILAFVLFNLLSPISVSSLVWHCSTVTSTLEIDGHHRWRTATLAL